MSRDLGEVLARVDMLAAVMSDLIDAWDPLMTHSASMAEVRLGGQLLSLEAQVRTVRSRIWQHYREEEG